MSDEEHYHQKSYTDQSVDEIAVHVVRDHEVPSWAVATSSRNAHDIHTDLHVLRDADQKRKQRSARRERAREAGHV